MIINISSISNDDFVYIMILLHVKFVMDGGK